MGAGPSRGQVTRAIRERLYKAQRTYGGRYERGTASTYACLIGDGWQLFPRLLRASNGEAALQWLVRTDPPNVTGPEPDFNIDRLMKAAGIPPLSHFIVEMCIAGTWENVWSEDDKPQTFRTRRGAEREIDELFRNVKAAKMGGYRRKDYRIVEVPR